MSDATRASYDAVAAEYAANLSGELAGKPMDREWLAGFARRVAGPVADLGCGPGHVTAHLAGLGMDVVGIDLSPGMVAQARAAYPDLAFEVADMRALGERPRRFVGLLAMYSLIHFDMAGLSAALRACHAALRPGGEICAAVHLGEGVVRPDALWGVPVRLNFHLFAPGALDAALRAAGFEVLESRARPPYPGAEHASDRAYVRAVRTTAGR
jgi:SAM-dependent methyltransferase